VAATGILPGSGDTGVGLHVRVPGRPAGSNDSPYFASYLSASPDYFEVMGIAVKAGRTFLPSDRRGAPPVAILSESAARALFPDGTAAGRLIEVPGRTVDIVRPGEEPPPIEIVAVVADVKLRGPEATQRLDQIYFSLLQSPPFGSLSFVAEADGEPTAIVSGLRAALADVDPTIPMYNVEPMGDVVRRFVASHRLAMSLVGGFAIVTLLVVAIGLYGLMAQFVAQRSRELGVRLALGADPVRLRRQVVGHGILYAATGSAIGAVAAFGAVQAFASMLPAFESVDARVLALNTAVLLFVAAVATWVPARRAGRIAVVDVLRDN
jgi:putative ABC transport system permease protein